MKSSSVAKLDLQSLKIEGQAIVADRGQLEIKTPIGALIEAQAISAERGKLVEALPQ